MRSAFVRLTALALLLVGASAHAGPHKVRSVGAVAMGVSAEACSGPAVSSVFAMDGDGQSYGQISFKITPATLGTSTYVRVSCKQGEASTGLVPVALCGTQTPIATCVEDVREYPLTSAGVTSVWLAGYAYMQCSFACDGNATINVVGQKVAR